MRIDRLTVQNFKGFAEREFEFPRRLDAPPDCQGSFHLLIGDNRSGKTNTLDALAVALAIWLVKPPDSTLQNSRRNILPSEIRLEPRQDGDRVQFRECKPVVVRAVGNLAGRANVSWTRQIREDGRKTTNAEAEEALEIVRDVYHRDHAGERIVCPVLAYYGAGRAWLASYERIPRKRANGPARRWAAFYDCFHERIRFPDLRQWFEGELIEAGNRGGRMRPGFEAVRCAILNCVPDADAVWYASDRREMVLSIGGHAQPFDNLSAGQRMMLALTADLAIKAVTQNAHLLPPDEFGPEDIPLPRVLALTPGVVLIDELDVHLHPKWQRRLIEDLRRTFPNLQFIATSHSPFVVQSLRPGELIPLEGQPVAQFDNLGIEAIARGLMGIPRPEVSLRYHAMMTAAKDYLLTLDEAAKSPADMLADFKERLAAGIAPYADNPAFQALLELEREARLGTPLANPDREEGTQSGRPYSTGVRRIKWGVNEE
jgi:predicted ATP-binding protein involved in virulence